MKKLLAIVMAIMSSLFVTACFGADDNALPVAQPPKPAEKTSSVASVSSASSQLVLEGKEQYVVVCAKGAGVKISKISEIKGKKVAVATDTDAHKIAKYYGASVMEIPIEFDAISGINSGDYSIVICRKTAADSASDKVDIILDPIVIE
jgi:hypothetical protein